MRLLTVGQVAEILGSSERYVLDEIRRKNLRASKLSGWRVREADLEAYVNAKANVRPVKRSA